MKKTTTILLIIITFLIIALIYMCIAFSNMKSSANMIYQQYESQKQITNELENELNTLKIEYNIVN